jgi:Secretion system C-terminal sorting domain
MKKLTTLLLVAMFCATQSFAATNNRYWMGTSKGGDGITWSDANNWNTAADGSGTSGIPDPAIVGAISFPYYDSDNIFFNGVTSSITLPLPGNINQYTFATLTLSGGANITFTSTSVSSNLTVNSFSIDATSSLNLFGTTTSTNKLSLTLASSTASDVNGTLILTGTSSSNHFIVWTGTGPINVNSGGKIVMANGGSGTFSLPSTTKLIIKSGGTYEYARATGTLPVAAALAGSTILFSSTSTGLGIPNVNSSGSFAGDIIYNLPNISGIATGSLMTGSSSMTYPATCVFKIQNIGTATCRFGSMGGLTQTNVSGLPSFEISAPTGIFQLANATTTTTLFVQNLKLTGACTFVPNVGTAAMTLNILGSVTQTAGIFDVNQGGSTMGIKVVGNISQTGGTIKGTSAGTNTITLNGTSPQTLGLAGTVTPPNFNVSVTNTMGVTLSSNTLLANNLSLSLNCKLFLGNYNLTIPNTYTGNNTNYVVTDGTGSLTINAVTSLKPFKIGSSATSYDPIYFSPATAVPFKVRVSSTLSHPVIDAAKTVSREWDITPTGTPGATNIDFSPDASALTATNSPTTPGPAEIGHWNGTTYDASNIIGTSDGAGTWSIVGYTGSFSPFVVAASGAVLAVEFTNINATAKGATNDINFSTATEKDVKEFAIERSTNNKTWETIGTKAAIGGSTATNYNFTDVNPATLSYYRVKSIETSGKEQTSKVVAVKRNGGKLAILAVFPMPYTEGSSIDFSVGKSSTVAVTVTDIVGRIVQSTTVKTTEGANNLRLNLSSLTSGSYILTMNDGETVATQRIVKQ